MVVGSATVKPGKIGTIKVSVIMHEGMGGPHLFHIFVKSSDPERRVTLLKVKADIVPLETWRRSHSDAFYLPRDVANFKLRSETEGIDAIAYASKVFGSHVQTNNALLGIYQKDKKEMRLLISEYPDSEKAKKLLSKMIERMGKNARASNQLRKIEVGGTPVYFLKNPAHEYFYFQSGNKVVFLFPDGSAAKQSLEEVLKHIKIQGS